MSGLTGKQRRHLRGVAHALDPVVQVGGKGLTAAVADETDRALGHHELIKVRLAGGREEREADAAALAGRTGAQLVGVIGRVAILYRQHPDPESRKVRLPPRG